MEKLNINKNDFIFFIKLGCSNKELGEVFDCSERTAAKRKVEWNLVGLTTNNSTSKITQGKRICLACGIEKPLSSFTKHASAKSGYRSKCKECRSNESKAWYKANKEHRNNIANKHYQNNKDSYYARYAKRRAKLKNAIPPWYSEKDESVFLELRERCKKLEEETGIPHEIDHIVPLQSDIVCGLHCKENWQILTRAENRSKGNKFIT